MSFYGQYFIRLILLYLLSWGIHSCSEPSTTEVPIKEVNNPGLSSNSLPAVKVKTIERKNFVLKQRTNGIIKSKQQALIKSNLGGNLIQIVEEGQVITKGALIAKFDDQELRLREAELEQELKEAGLKRDELMIRFSGTVGVDSSVSKKQLAVILMQSGYTKIEKALDKLRFQISQTEIRAPFTGIIANRKVNNYERISANTEICTLIDQQNLEVEFKLLEQEIVGLKRGQSIQIIPIGLGGSTLNGKLDIINPVVDESGLIRVRAKLGSSRKGKLYVGMNAEVIIELSMGEYLVVPKSAVVERSNRKLVFVFDEDQQRAIWQYVKIAHENDKEAAILEGLDPNDQIIYEGNLNLDHEAKVRSQKAESI